MFGLRRFWKSLVPCLNSPLIDQPFLILAHLVKALLWVLIASAACVGRVLTVVAGEAAFIGGIVLCLLGLGHIGVPLGVVGFITSRIAA